MPIRLDEHAPEALRIVRVIGGVLAILAERDRVRALIGASRGSEPGSQARLAQWLVVEVGDRQGERHPFLAAIGFVPDEQRMMMKSKSILKRASVVRDWGGGQARGVT